MIQDIITILSSTDNLRQLLSGTFHSILITFCAALIGLALGFIVAAVKIAPNNKWTKLPKIICNVYTTVFRGTPVALQLFIMVYAVLAIPGFDAYAAIITFGINSGAYVSESIRAGILSVDKGQMEAGRALGLNWVQTMIRIVLPQAIKNIIPAIGNEMIALLKETSIISWIGYIPGTLTQDLNAVGNNFYYEVVSNYLACGIVVGCCYLAIVYLMVLVIKLIERSFAKNER